MGNVRNQALYSRRLRVQIVTDFLRRVFSFAQPTAFLDNGLTLLLALGLLNAFVVGIRFRVKLLDISHHRTPLDFNLDEAVDVHLHATIPTVLFDQLGVFGDVLSI